MKTSKLLERETVGRDLAERMANEPRLQKTAGLVAHVDFDLRFGHEGRRRVDDDRDRPPQKKAHEHVRRLERLIAVV